MKIRSYLFKLSYLNALYRLLSLTKIRQIIKKNKVLKVIRNTSLNMKYEVELG